MGCGVASATVLDLQTGSPCNLWSKHITWIIVEECLVDLHIVGVMAIICRGDRVAILWTPLGPKGDRGCAREQ